MTRMCFGNHEERTIPMSEHTPGPWYTHRSAVPDWCEQNIIASEPDGVDVALTYRSKADAALIAAAPDMLAALEVVRDFLTDEPYLHTKEWDAVNAAIRKARGED